MPWRGPAFAGDFPSLGPEIISWWETHLRVPAGELAGQPLVLTPDQCRFFCRLYALTSSGKRVYRRASRRGAKGRGKSPEGALFLLADFAGPVVFDGWDANGEPIAKPRWNPLAWAAATAEDQTDNVYAALREMIADSSLDGIDAGKTRIEFTDGRPGKIEAVTASAGAREGAPTTAVVLDETHLWFPSKGGDKLAAVIRRNLGKTGGQSLEVTNAPALGENSVAEKTLEAANKGQRGLLYDSVEASWDENDDPKDPACEKKLRAALDQAYEGVRLEDGGWVDVDRQYEETQDIGVSRADVLRFYLNIADKAENRAFDARQVAAAVKSRDVAKTPKILMFDGARTRDCAVLSSWTIEDVPHHQMVQAWLRPHDPHATYEHPRGEIRSAVRDFIADNDCQLFVYDSSFHELSSLYDEWIDEYEEADESKGTGLMVGFPTAAGKRMEAAIDRTIEDLREGLFTHDGDDVITEHLENAVLGKNRSGYRVLIKEKDSLKIDGAVTFTMGYDMIPTGRIMLENRLAAPAIYVAYS